MTDVGGTHRGLSRLQSIETTSFEKLFRLFDYEWPICFSSINRSLTNTHPVKRHSLRGFLIFLSQASVVPVIGRKVADFNLPGLDL